MCITSQKIGSIARKTHTLRLQGSINVLTALEIMDMYDAEIAGIECESSFVGIFHRRDFAKNIARDRLDPENTTLYEVMTLDMPSIAYDATIKDAYEKMLACHASQRDWLLKQHGIDEYLNSCERWSRQRGGELGVDYAEAFRQHKGHPYPHDNRLLELLG